MTNADQPSERELREARERFASLLASSHTTEPDYQRLLAECPYIFSRSLGLAVKPSDIRPLGRPGKTEPDFVFYPSGLHPVPFYGVIEIKRHDSPILGTPRKQLITLSQTANTAVAQGQFYLRQMEKTLAINPRSTLFVGDPSMVFVIMGLTDELISKVTSEILKEQFLQLLPTNSRIVPYDQLLSYFEQTIPPRILCLLPSPVPEIRPRRVIWLDDNAATLSRLASMFVERYSERSVDLEAYWAVDEVLEALARDDKPIPSVVVLDMAIAGSRMDGLECGRRIREWARTKSVPLAFYTFVSQFLPDDVKSSIAPPVRFFQRKEFRGMAEVFQFVDECIETKT